MGAQGQPRCQMEGRPWEESEEEMWEDGQTEAWLSDNLLKVETSQEVEDDDNDDDDDSSKYSVTTHQAHCVGLSQPCLKIGGIDDEFFMCVEAVSWCPCNTDISTAVICIMQANLYKNVGFKTM